nr:hypothetical protein [Streptomyces spiralis]
MVATEFGFGTPEEAGELGDAFVGVAGADERAGSVAAPPQPDVLAGTRLMGEDLFVQGKRFGMAPHPLIHAGQFAASVVGRGVMTAT